MKLLSRKAIIKLEKEYKTLLDKRDKILDSMYDAELTAKYSEWDMLHEELLKIESEIEAYENILNI